MSRVTGINIETYALRIPDKVDDPCEAIDRQGHAVDVWDGNGDFGRRFCADIEADGAVDAGEIGSAEAFGLQPLQSLGMGPGRAQRTDVEGVGAQCLNQCRVVQFGVVRQGHDSRAPVGR